MFLDSYNITLDDCTVNHICDGDNLDDVLSKYDYLDYADSYNGLTYIQRVQAVFHGVPERIAYMCRKGVHHV